MKKIDIGNRLVGEGEPCFIIAEAGVNHNGDIKLAKKLIDVAKKAGADAVKFQTFITEEVVTMNAEKAMYQKETTGKAETQFGMIKKLELSKEEFKELFHYAQKKDIMFLSTPFDKGSVDFLDSLGVSAFKIPSGEITNFPLLGHIVRKKKPIILSTGMSTMDEIREALDVIQKEGSKEIILLHCVTSYPANVEDMNLRVMATLRNVFNLPVGLSDHTLGIIIPIAAVALGACVVEKHFTLDKSLPGPDHRASLEPAELKSMVRAIRDVERAMGDGIKRPTKAEQEIKIVARRSLVAKINIPKGTIITEDILEIKRPGNGIPPNFIGKVLGKKASRDLKADELISFDKIEA